MVNLISFILVSAGITNILCYSSLFDKFRPKHGKLGELFQCSMCLGFYVGAIISVAFHFDGIELFPRWYTGIIYCAFISSVTSYIIDKMISDDGIKINIHEKNGNVVKLLREQTWK